MQRLVRWSVISLFGRVCLPIMGFFERKEGGAKEGGESVFGAVSGFCLGVAGRRRQQQR